MCIGVPMQVIRCEGVRALCRHRDETRWIDLSLVGPQSPGTWVMTFLDHAREVLDEESARRALSALDTLIRVQRGEALDLERGFADLVDREPLLPPHLAALVESSSSEEES